MRLPTVVFPFPSSSAHASCVVLAPSNRSNIVLICATDESDEHLLIVADVHIGTVVAYDG